MTLPRLDSNQQPFGSLIALRIDTKIAVLAEVWFAEISGQDRSPGTLRAYRDRLDRQVIPALGSLRVRELSTGMVDRHLRAVRDRHGAAMAKLCRTVFREWLGSRPDMMHSNTTRFETLAGSCRASRSGFHVP
jgi:Phage integrase central domain